MATGATLTRSYWPADTSDELIDLSLGELLRQVSAEVPDLVAVVVGDPDPGQRVRVSYRQLLERSTLAAQRLATEFKPGTRVAIWAPNSLEFELLQLGASMAGLTLVMVNPALTAGEASYILGQSRSTAVFYDDRHLDGALSAAVEQIRGGLPSLKSAHPLSGWEAYVSEADTGSELPVVDPQSPAQIQYTSGTTGFPKGAVLRHQALVTNAKTCNVRSGVDFGAVFINPLPMFHVGSCTLSVIGAIVRRGTHVLIPRFDPALALELVESERGNIMVMVPTVMHMLMEHPDILTRDLSSLKTIFSGGANVPQSVVERAKAIFGCHFTNGFGQTEAHGTVIQTAFDDAADDQAKTVGRPLPLVEVKIASLEDGEPVPVGQIGEICLRGYQTMTCYFDKPEETAAALDDAGWLHTGDLGTMDERGFVSITARIKDMIIRGGENVYPAEVESVIIEHPDVVQVQVIGIPDEKWGEQVGAAVKFSEASTRDAAAVYEFCRERLASFKTPRLWYEVDSFPTTASGKIQKFALADQAQEGTLSLLWTTGSRRGV